VNEQHHKEELYRQPRRGAGNSDGAEIKEIKEIQEIKQTALCRGEKKEEEEEEN